MSGTDLAESSATLAARRREVARLFLRLGLTAFGGPAAHIAAMEDEVVRKRAWISREEFVDLVSAANVIPGPNSTELAIHLGFRRAGRSGLLLAGALFILPATLIVWATAVAYVRFGQRPETSAILSGMQPVVLAVVVQALWRLGSTILRTPPRLVITIASLIACVCGVHELIVLAVAALVASALALRSQNEGGTLSGVGASWWSWQAVTSSDSTIAVATGAATGAVGLASLPSTLSVFGSFLKIGSVLFGSGYVLLAFLRAEFVERNAWLTQSQLLDAIAIGQITPGPVFTSATFVGYLLAGHGGAAAATLGIFLPAFIFVVLSGPLVRRIRQYPVAGAALDGVNAASLALMMSVVILMLPPIVTSGVAIGIFLVAAIALLSGRISAGWMLLAGAVIGLMQSHFIL